MFYDAVPNGSVFHNLNPACPIAGIRSCEKMNLLLLVFSCIRINCEQSIGVREIAVNVEVHTVIQTIHPNCLNKIPVIPVTRVNGKNTATVTRVVTITDNHTSFVPYLAASRRTASPGRYVSLCFPTLRWHHPLPYRSQ